jgi:photosystem II stability/assembly factor-like uncharacterized protein
MKKTLLPIFILILISTSLSAQLRVYAPELKAPVNEAIEQSPDVLLDWNAVTGEGIEISYEVQLAENPEFTNATLFPSVTVTALKMSNLLFGHVYYWRVRAIDAVETSEWSVTWSFTVITTVLIQSPTNLTVVSPDPVIVWKELTGVTGYDIQVDTSYSWVVQAGVTTSKLNDVFEIDENHIWFVGDNGLVIQKLNGEWNTISIGSSVNLFDVFFTDNDNGWIVGDNGKIFYYDGNEFTEQASGLTTPLNGVYFTSSTNGFAVGNGGKILRFDGVEWTPMTVNLTADLLAIHGNGTSNIMAVGKTGKYAQFNGTSWLDGTYSNRDMNDVWVTPSGKVWVAARAGRIFSYNGTTWSEQLVGTPPRDLQGVCFLNDQNGYIVGNNGTLLYFNGLVWQTLASGTTENINGIYLASNQSGYLAGNAGTIIKYQGEGFNSPYLHNYSTPGGILEFKLANLLFGQPHYFRVRAKHAADISEWSPASSFRVIDKPTLSSPADNATNISLDTLVKWQAITGVAKYSIQLSDNAGFENPRLFESTIPEYRFDELVFSKDYWWRVNARHAADISAWSIPRKLSTANTVTLVSPANNANNVSRLPRYEWQNIRGTEKYMIQHGKDNTFTTTETDLVTDPFYQTIFQLEKQTTYYWRVKAIQGLDSTNWSQVRSFVTEGETSVGELNFTGGIAVYPNPGAGEFTITLNKVVSDNFTIEVYNLTGSKVFEQTRQTVVSSGQAQAAIDLRQLNKGMYLLRISDGKSVRTKRIVIE